MSLLPPSSPYITTLENFFRDLGIIEGCKLKANEKKKLYIKMKSLLPKVIYKIRKAQSFICIKH